MEIVNQLDDSLWKDFVDNHPQGNIFHTPEMFEVYARTKGSQPNIWAGLDANGQLLALFLPVQITMLDRPILRKLTTRAVVYGSVLCACIPEWREMLELLLQSYKQTVEKHVLFTELRNHSNTDGLQPVLFESGMAYEEHLNFLIDLQREPEIILKSFNRDARRRISRNLKQGTVTIKEITDRSQINIFYSLLQKTYGYARVPLADISLFEAAFDILLPKKMARFVMAYIDNVPVTASASLLYKDTIYGWYNGTDRAYRSYGPNEFEVWELINWGIEHGYRILDFGGAGRPGEKYGVRDFKAKFNGRLVNFGRYAYIHNPLRMKLSKVSYGTARNLMQTMQNMYNKFIPKEK